MDEARGLLRSALGSEPSLRDLVRCLVEPYAELLESAPGRSYLRIVAQLRGRFAAWRVESDVATTQHLSRILDEIESSPAVPSAVRRERVLALIILLTGSVAERARRIDEDVPVDLPHESFVSNLVDMCAALLATS